MIKNQNISIVSIEDNDINGNEETNETSTEASIKPPSDDLPKKKTNVPEHKEEQLPSSVTFIDTNLSRKYTITLEQARNRVLRAIMEAKKRNLSLGEEDD